MKHYVVLFRVRVGMSARTSPAGSSSWLAEDANRRAGLHGALMLKLAIVTLMLCFASNVSAAGTRAGAQAAAFMHIYLSLCVKHVTNLDALRDKLQPMPKLPPEKARHFLFGRAGDAWPVPDKSGLFVLTLPKGIPFCAVYARRADTVAVERAFKAMLARAPSPLVAKQVENKNGQTPANGKTHTIAYEWYLPNARQKMLFMLTTAPSPTAQLQVLGSASIVSE